MARRRAARIRARGDKTALAALRTDRFKLPVLLGSYSDLSGTLKVQDFQNHLFSDSTGLTMTDYFEEVSYGQFSITGDVYGWYQTDKPVADYLPSNYSDFSLDIVQQADPEIDFSPYDNDGPDGVPNSGDDDGYVDAVMVIFAGVGREYGNQNNLNSAQIEANPGYTTDDPAHGGGFLKIRCLVLVSELGELGDTVGISSLGVACHEFGHVLGLPDLYDGTGLTNGLGNWGLMSGSLNSHLSAWCKIMLGWVSPVVVEEQTYVLLNPVETNPEVYLLWEDGYGLSRYFLLEHRQKNAGFDTGIPGTGLMIYHVNENRWQGLAKSKRATQSLSNRLVDLEEADGRNDLDHKGNPGDSGDPFPGSTGNTTFDDFSNPSSRDYEGNPTGVSITNIQYRWSLPAMGADVSPREPLGYSIAYDRMGIAGGWNNADYWGGVLFKAGEPGYLAAVDIGIPSGDSEYEVRIYHTINDTLPEGLIHSVSGYAPLPGYNTVKIDRWIKLEKGQEFFVAYRSSNGVWLDDLSEYTGRSYASDNGIGYGQQLSNEQGSGVNINIRARIRTENPVVCDFNGDGKTDRADIVAMIRFLQNNPGNPQADFNRDGYANVADALSLMLALRNGTCPE
ncbi:MAG: M6 family metalloprotease domain-containing protein [Candidatus Glassbacteria bacterium]|nr:M6 family metalloprotease domain-containing protein [Candidatus Glassbacteria bacterium]